jgi:hypothetical protein
MVTHVPILPAYWTNNLKGRREMLTKPGGKAAVLLAALVILLGVAALLPAFAQQAAFK